jgi:DNA-binding transcriptional regulator YiaG
MNTKIKPPTAKQVGRLRTASGLSAEAFGQIVYVGAAAVYAWEKGRRHCPLSAWEMLLIYFGKAEPRRAMSCSWQEAAK